MRIAPEGMATIVIAGLLFLISLLAWIWVRSHYLGYLAAAFLLVTLFMLFFFRDPERSTRWQPGQIISPADGKVVVVAPVRDSFLIKGPALQISVFLSPLDVHINRIPVKGRVIHRQYHPGKFLPAFEEKASLANEQMHLGIETDGGTILMKQIAGILARRVVCYPDIGDRVEAGQRMGLMKFGSRVDLLLPPDSEALVKPGDRVVGGVSLLARLKSKGDRYGLKH